MSGTHTNALIHESSPYLLQHAHNPVNWHPWNPETLEKARVENKLLIVSVGYAACHWCHVMEHESFEDEEVAALMNRYFIPVKVDREERPDVDQIYMNAAHISGIRGGWPLNAFALPDGRPFFAGTYFPKANWMDVLRQIADLYEQEPERLERAASQIAEGIRSMEVIDRRENVADPVTLDDLNASFGHEQNNIDLEYGGEKGAPKFPMPVFWEYLLHFYAATGNKECLQAVETTLNGMASGGIYDHTGGGFARYSTDERWFAPHFEKMLYDNAQLVSLYAHAYQLTENQAYREVVYETLQFVEKELLSPEGGFYASLDADSEGEEGKYYLWTEEETRRILGTDALLFNAVYNVLPEGNFEKGRNILHRTELLADYAEKYHLPLPELEEKLRACRQLLAAERNKRVKPGLDDKILTSWNALMITGYLQAYKAFGDEKFLQTALRNAHFLLRTQFSGDGGIRRNYRSGRSSIDGMLDDYSFLMEAFTGLYQVTFDESWLTRACVLLEYVISHFSTGDSPLFFYTRQNTSGLFARGMEKSDNVIPASNSSMAANLYTLGQLLDEPAYISRAVSMLQFMRQDITGQLFYHARWASLALLHITGATVLAVTGSEALQLSREVLRSYLPNLLIAGATDDSALPILQHKTIPGSTLGYVCYRQSCDAPSDNATVLADKIRTYGKGE